MARSIATLVLLALLAACGAKAQLPQAPDGLRMSQANSTAETFAQYGNDAATLLETGLFVSTGYWHLCKSGCGVTNSDWGADSLTYTSFLRWQTHSDASLRPLFSQLAKTATTYGSCTPQFCPYSDQPAWDSIADSRVYKAIGDPQALAKARAAYAYVANSNSLFRFGACPQIRYQIPHAGGGGLKTLETDANMIKAALLLYGETGTVQYLDDAQTTYAAVRQWFRDPALPLYTVYIFDNGAACTQLPHRFFASVNGDMIWNGVRLYTVTKQHAYLDDALATAGAVETNLSDARGIFNDLQAENDVVEPLVEGMFDLATVDGDTKSSNWILTNARAALAQDRSSDGYYGRFFDGPTPTWNVTVWQLNGGLALAIAAAALSPAENPDAGLWSNAHFVADAMTGIPSKTITFTGSGIAVVGAIGNLCCQAGHAGVLLDSKPIVDETGVWQNKSSSNLRIPGAVLFQWRWTTPGAHTVQFVSNGTNAKEGSPYINVDGYYVLP